MIDGTTLFRRSSLDRASTLLGVGRRRAGCEPAVAMRARQLQRSRAVAAEPDLQRILNGTGVDGDRVVVESRDLA